MSELLSIFALALMAMVNPTLLAAVTIMMLLPNTKRLMLGYLLGAYTTSITLGMLIAFSLHNTESADTAQSSLAPGQDIALGLLALGVAYALGGGRADRLRERRRRRRAAKGSGESPHESWPERMLGRGSARVTFAVGVALSFPGVAYLTALDRIAKLDATAVETALMVLAVALIQQLLLEVPLLGYACTPERTERAVARFRDWIARRGSHVATVVAAVISALLIVRGLIGFLA